MDSRDLNRIRELAKEQLEIAKSPEMEALGKAWTELNDCKRIKPLVTVETATFANEVIPPLMKCTTEEGRSWEYMLLGNIINHKYFGDDTFVRDFIPVGYGSYMKPFDIDVKTENTSGLGHHFVSVISDLGADFEKLKPSSIGICPREGTSSPTTPSGAATSSGSQRRATSRPSAYSSSTTWWRRIRQWKK